MLLAPFMWLFAMAYYAASVAARVEVGPAHLPCDIHGVIDHGMHAFPS